MPERADEQAPPQSQILVPTTAVQHRALDAVRDTASVRAGEQLLKKTGPLAELNAAARRHVLDEARQVLIAKKGAGVIFEAKTVIHLQDAAERFQLDLSASLSARANDPRADVVAFWAEEQIELQLKVGSDRYIRAAVRSRLDGTIVLVPSDAVPPGMDGVTSSLDFDGVTFESPSRQELIDSADASLQRMAVGESQVTAGTIAVNSVCSGLVDGVVAAILDLTIQKLSQPDADIDWSRTVSVFLKAGAISTVGSFIAAANTMSALDTASHAIDAGALLSGSRVTAAVLPRIVDVGLDFYAHSEGQLPGRELARRVTKHAVAGTAEYLLFPVIARLALRCGPIGGVLVILGGGLLISRMGEGLGDVLFDLVEQIAALPPPSPELQAKIAEGFGRALQQIATVTRDETTRRNELSKLNLCEENACGRSYHARGMCSTHYNRWWRQQRRRYGRDWQRFVQPSRPRIGSIA
jgi:hypothetical protein